MGPAALIVCYFAAAFIENDGIPLIKILRGEPYDIYGFRIPGLHVVTLAFTSYHALRYWRRVLTASDRRSLTALALILALVKAMGRSAISFIIFAGFVMFLRAQRITALRLGVGVAVVVGFLYAFGLFGNERLAYQIEQETGQQARGDVVLDYAEATPAFDDSGLDPAWMWPYLYFSSPLANLNVAIQEAQGAVCGQRCDLDGLLLYELMPDSVGDKIARNIGVDELDRTDSLVRPDLTASTTFGPAASYAGFVGITAVAVVLLFVGLVSSKLLRGSPLREEGLAILWTVFFFSFFDNMVAYSPLSLQLGLVVVAATLARHRDRLLKAPPASVMHRRDVLRKRPGRAPDE